MLTSLYAPAQYYLLFLKHTLCFLASVGFFLFMLPLNLSKSSRLRCPCQRSPISDHLPDSSINRCGFSPLPPCLSQCFDCASLPHFHNLTYDSYYIGLFFHILQRMCRHHGCKPCDRITFAPLFPLQDSTLPCSIHVSELNQ